MKVEELENSHTRSHCFNSLRCQHTSPSPQGQALPPGSLSMSDTPPCSSQVNDSALTICAHTYTFRYRVSHCVLGSKNRSMSPFAIQYFSGSKMVYFPFQESYFFSLVKKKAYTPEAEASGLQGNIILYSVGSPRANLGYRHCQKSKQAKKITKEYLKNSMNFIFVRLS